MSSEQFSQESLPRRREADYPSVRRFTYREMKKDQEQLRLLSIFYYLCAALYGLIGLFPGIYVGLGVAMVSGAMGPPPNGPPPEVGFIFIGIGSVAMLIAATFAVCLIVAGRSLTQQKRYVFCFVMAILLCIGGVPGIVLGVFTIIVIVRESVKELFARGDLAFGPPDEND